MNRITRGLPFVDYLAIDAVHNSTLKAIDVSPKHYAHARRNTRKDSPALVIGRVLHSMLLDPEPPHVAVYEGKVRAGKEWLAFCAAHPNETILKRSELEDCAAMRAAILAHPPAAALFAEGEGEVTIEWSQYGIQCKGRIDWLRPCSRWVEVKTTRKIQPARFAHEAGRFLYHAQLAFYDDGLTAITGEEREPPTLVTVEKFPPYDVAVYRVPQETLDIGRRKVDDWLRKLAAARDSGRWDGVAPGLVDLVLPDYLTTDGLGDVDLTEIEAEGEGNE